MKARLLYLLILCCTSCMVDWGPTPYYTYDETPYTDTAMGCYDDPWMGECCDWVVATYYDECIETWCYDYEWDEWVYHRATDCITFY